MKPTPLSLFISCAAFCATAPFVSAQSSAPVTAPVTASSPFRIDNKPWMGAPKPPSPSAEVRHDNEATLRWDAGAQAAPNAIWHVFAKDLSFYDTLSFWYYAENATDAKIQITVEAGAGGQDLYETDFIVDTAKTWVNVKLPLATFKKNRNPLGWDQAHGFSFTTNRHGNAPVAGTVLYFHKVQFELAP